MTIFYKLLPIIYWASGDISKTDNNKEVGDAVAVAFITFFLILVLLTLIVPQLIKKFSNFLSKKIWKDQYLEKEKKLTILLFVLAITIAIVLLLLDLHMFKLF